MGNKKRKAKAAAVEQFSDGDRAWSAGSDAFAAWLRGESADEASEAVTASSVMGLAAVRRAVEVLAGTIAGLPLRTYERGSDGTRARIDSVFDDPWAGPDGLTQFAWVETVVAHLAVWRRAFLWHEDRDPVTGEVSAYRPVLPDAILKVERSDGRKLFTFRDGATGENRTVGTDTITHIPGMSLDGLDGHPLLSAARAVFSGAISGDKAAQTTLRRGIRLAGLLTPADEQEDVSPDEGDAIMEQLRSKVVGRENAGDVALINKRVKLQPWTPNNIESQWAETRQFWLGEAGRLFGIPPHLLNDTEKQTSWGAGVAEQTLNFARFTLMGYTSRIEQVLSQRLPEGQFVEFDYAGLLQGTPAEEIGLLLEQVAGGLLTLDEARQIRNLRPLTPKQKAEAALRSGAVPRPVVDQEAPA